MQEPFFSIITINYNNHKGLEKTINSVIAQTFTNYEFLIIDGGSSDNFHEIIKKYGSKISLCISEKDKGIYDAQNKGINRAKGEYLIFMNSGDCFAENNTLDKVYEFMALYTGHSIYYGNTHLVDEDGTKRFLAPPEVLDMNFFYLATLNHQSCFIHRSLFARYGLYNLQYKIGADYDFFFKVFLNEPHAYVYMNEVISDYENYGTSANTKFFDLIVKERKLIQQALLNKNQLNDLFRLEIRLLGRRSNWFKYVPDSEKMKRLYDRFYFRWYKLIAG
jgi:glycosyltransferase involved in cell wall biosynthesis